MSLKKTVNRNEMDYVHSSLGLVDFLVDFFPFCSLAVRVSSRALIVSHRWRQPMQRSITERNLKRMEIYEYFCYTVNPLRHFYKSSDPFFFFIFDTLCSHLFCFHVFFYTFAFHFCCFFLFIFLPFYLFAFAGDSWRRGLLCWQLPSIQEGGSDESGEQIITAASVDRMCPCLTWLSRLGSHVVAHMSSSRSG